MTRTRLAARCAVPCNRAHEVHVVLNLDADDLASLVNRPVDRVIVGPHRLEGPTLHQLGWRGPGDTVAREAYEDATVNFRSTAHHKCCREEAGEKAITRRLGNEEVHFLRMCFQTNLAQRTPELREGEAEWATVRCERWGERGSERVAEYREVE